MVPVILLPLRFLVLNSLLFFCVVQSKKELSILGSHKESTRALITNLPSKKGQNLTLWIINSNIDKDTEKDADIDTKKAMYSYFNTFSGQNSIKFIIIINQPASVFKQIHFQCQGDLGLYRLNSTNILLLIGFLKRWQSVFGSMVPTRT